MVSRPSTMGIAIKSFGTLEIVCLPRASSDQQELLTILGQRGPLAPRKKQFQIVCTELVQATSKEPQETYFQINREVVGYAVRGTSVVNKVSFSVVPFWTLQRFTLDHTPLVQMNTIVRRQHYSNTVGSCKKYFSILSAIGIIHISQKILKFTSHIKVVSENIPSGLSR